MLSCSLVLSCSLAFREESVGTTVEFMESVVDISPVVIFAELVDCGDDMVVFGCDGDDVVFVPFGVVGCIVDVVSLSVVVCVFVVVVVVDSLCVVTDLVVDIGMMEGVDVDISGVEVVIVVDELLPVEGDDVVVVVDDVVNFGEVVETFGVEDVTVEVVGIIVEGAEGGFESGSEVAVGVVG